MAKNGFSDEQVDQAMVTALSYVELLLQEMEALRRHGQQANPTAVGEFLMPVIYGMQLKMGKPLTIYDFKDPEEIE